MKTNNKVHVLYILTKLELGGAQKVCLSLMNGLQQAGHQVGIISGKEGLLVSQTAQFDHVFLLDSFKREVGIRTVFSEIKAFFLIIRFIKKLKTSYPNLMVHTHSTKAGILGRWAAWFSGIKKRIHTVHGFGFNDHQSTTRWMLIYFFELITSCITTHYICVSRKDQKEGESLFPRFNKKNSLIRAAVDWKTFYMPATQISHERNADFIIGAISCFKPQKNLIDLLKAFKLATEKVTARPLRLQIIGDGAMRAEIEQWIASNNMERHIDLLGWQNNVAHWLRSWNLFAMSSLWEGLPCSSIEARLSHLPVVAYRIGGLPEVIFNNKNGFLVQPGDWQDLSEKITILANNQKLYRAMRLFPDNLSDFNNEIMVRKHIDLYQS